jgi:UDP-glucose 4-epimerase
MKVLVTGGLRIYWFSHCCGIQNKGFDVVIIDNLSNSSVEVLEGITQLRVRNLLLKKWI